MDALVCEYLSSIELGEVQEFQDMAVVPLFTALEHSTDYITLKEAMEKEHITVTEVDASGYVPELKVINQAEIPVLLLDGEELVGAKQNRILNTSILLKEKL